METITKKYDVYSFDELSEEAKEKAIIDTALFWLEVIPYEEMTGNLKKAVNRAEELKTPWFTPSYIYDYCKDEIIEVIKINGWQFTKDGEIF